MIDRRATRILLKIFARTNNFLATMKNRAISSSGDEPSANKRHWRAGLLDTMEDPESIVKEDERIIVIKDKYPKSHHHYLVLPKEDIASIHHLTREHVNILEHMEKIGQEIATERNDHEFIMGYHAVPSMHRLHLHVISTDFDSPFLKNKYHWNSFTTPFFRPSEAIRKELSEHGDIKKTSSSVKDEHLKKDLCCHKCSYRPKNMPDLKKHLLTHLK